MKTKHKLFPAFFFLFAALLMVCQASAQTGYIWATASLGGCNGVGTIVRGSADGSHFETVACFDDTIGGQPEGSPVMCSNGKLYVVSFIGGYDDSCTICSFDTATGQLEMVVDMYNPNTQPIITFNPVGGLVLAANGKLYGLAASGGINNYGAIYCLDPATNAYQVVYSFPDSMPSVSKELMLASDGKFYLIAYTPDARQDSVAIHSFDPATNILTRLPNLTWPYSYLFNVGYNPFYALIQGSDNKLYGLRNLYDSIVGADSSVIYSYDLTTETNADLYYIGYQAWGIPTSGLVQGNDGKLYGMIQGIPYPNQGTVYSFDIGTHQFQSVVQSDSTYDGLTYATTYDITKYGADELVFATEYANDALYQGALIAINTVNRTTRVMLGFDSATTGMNPACNILLTGISNISGIAEVNPPTISLYPNPAIGNISVNNISVAQPYKVTDLLGQVLIEGTLTQVNHTIDISALTPGIYFINHLKFLKI